MIVVFQLFPYDVILFSVEEICEIESCFSAQKCRGRTGTEIYMFLLRDVIFTARQHS